MVGNCLGFDVYLAMRGTWLGRIPKGLENQDPDLVMRLLGLANTNDGISQSVAMRALNISQSRTSKLKDRLVHAEWVRTWKPTPTSRVLLMSTTPKAKAVIARMFDDMLSHCRHASR
jgi:hypothetical protein